MPYKSDAQRRYMHARHPEIAARWDAEIRAKKKKPVVKRVMSDTEIRHRKKVQGAVSRTTGALGLASLGAFGAGRLGGGGKYALKAQKAVPMLRRINPKTADKVALGTSTAGAGIGGAGSFNFAAYTSAEAKKRNRMVKKNWQPQGRYYHPEMERKKRNKRQRDVANVAGGAAIGGGGILADRALKVTKPGVVSGSGDLVRDLRAASSKRRVTVVKPKSLKAAGALAGAGAASLGVGEMIRRKEKTTWQPYAKSAEVSKIGDWKTIDQRERTQTRQRKAMRNAGAAAGVGVGLGALGYAQGDQAKYQSTGRAVRGYLKSSGKGKILQDSVPVRAKTTGRLVAAGGKSLSGSGKAGLALLGGAAVVGSGAKVGHTYQQHKINQRRRAYQTKVRKSSLSAFGVDHY